MSVRPLGLQWHLTDRCSRRCAHCYMYDEATFEPGPRAEMSLADCRVAIAQFVALTRKLSAITGARFVPRFILSGGDPILHRDFWAVLEAVAAVAPDVMILGNADHLDPATVEALAARGVTRYQLSLDGLEAHHDAVRGPGSFATTVAGLELLSAAKIRAHVMATVFRDNMADLGGLIDLAVERRAASFAFARATAFGNARDLDRTIAPRAYRELLLATHEQQERHQRAGATPHFPRKDHLWVPLLHELGAYKVYPHVKPGRTVGGCHMGQTFMVLLADGSVMACRRFHSPIGRFPEQSLADIFLRSRRLASYRKVGQLEACRDCELLYHCRGCPAVAAGAHGDWRAPDPQCWRAAERLAAEGLTGQQVG